MNLRDGFRAITDGWRRVDDCVALAERIRRVALWNAANGPLWPDEETTLELMVDCWDATSPEIRPQNFRRRYARPSL